ncbi:hypothetical protein RvY_07901 [Ramazzottius varieornatus]|uniref:Uncharacterized protein n=1 Tax=Ramazzottius varieornatus TaxID=947166 RepID=A0A1D1V3W5_RAMVA|nr:hypothetical protein RvY_07901 [Ramazzottius varieornatus]
MFSTFTNYWYYSACKTSGTLYGPVNLVELYAAACTCKEDKERFWVGSQHSAALGTLRMRVVQYGIIPQSKVLPADLQLVFLNPSDGLCPGIWSDGHIGQIGNFCRRKLEELTTICFSSALPIEIRRGTR